MGGYGSGGWNSTGRYEVEDCNALSCSWLTQNNLFELSLGDSRALQMTWSLRDQWLYTLNFVISRPVFDRLEMFLHQTGQQVSLYSEPMRFGGIRWRFYCPRCFNRCMVLYKPPGSIFLCRRCHDLTYRSCRESHRYDAMWGDLALRCGFTYESVKELYKEDDRARRKTHWRRKRDRRPGYKSRQESVDEVI